MQRLKVLKSHQGFMKYFKNTSWLFGEKILRIVTGLFVGVWVARYLGPEQFGIFSYALSFVGLFTFIATLGLDEIVVRELVKDESRRDELIGTAFWLKLFGALVMLVILAIAVNFTSNDTYINTLIFIIASATIFQSFNVVNMYFQSKVISKYVVYANIISLFISSLVKITLILNEAPLSAFALVALFDSFILACGLVYFYISYNRYLAISNGHSTLDSVSNFSMVKNLKFGREMALSLLKDSWPLALVGVASTLNMRIDQVMLGNMMSFEVVGNYAAAVRVSEIWFLIPVVIGASIFPAIIRAHKLSLELYRKRIFSTVKYMSLFAIPSAIIVTFLSNYIIWLLYGEQFKDAGLYLSLHIWTGLPYVALFALSQIIVIENLTRWSLYITVFVVTVNISLNYILIPIYSAIGAIVVSLIVSWSAQLIAIFILYKKTNIFHD
jgi:O-antigen/teichoic acid export membrane protein